MSRDADTLRRIEQLEKRAERLEAATFTAEQLATYLASDAVLAAAEAKLEAAEWRATVWPMLTPEEREKVDKAMPGAVKVKT